jgi:hypothetical protein
MELPLEKREVQESAAKSPENLSPTGISAMQGDFAFVVNKPGDTPPPAGPHPPADVLTSPGGGA